MGGKWTQRRLAHSLGWTPAGIDSILVAFSYELNCWGESSGELTGQWEGEGREGCGRTPLLTVVLQQGGKRAISGPQEEAQMLRPGGSAWGLTRVFPHSPSTATPFPACSVSATDVHTHHGPATALRACPCEGCQPRAVDSQKCPPSSPPTRRPSLHASHSACIPRASPAGSGPLRPAVSHQSPRNFCGMGVA